jgi:pimeloyl-ACP methyl ester carboxylesterase
MLQEQRDLNHMSSPVQAAFHAIHTRDGWELGLFRLAPCSEPVALPPVLLLPGYATDHGCFLPPSGGGLARALSAAGRDVWMLDFRGTGRSRPLSRRAGSVDVDGRLLHDLPAAVAAIIERVGADQVDVGGHSLGGVVLLLHLALAVEHRVRRGVTLASALLLGAEPSRGLRALGAQFASGIAARMPRLPTRALVGAITRVPGVEPFGGYFHPTNHPGSDARSYVRNMITDMHGSELAQLAQWAGAGRLPAHSAPHDWRERLSWVDTPLLFVAGGADRVVRVPAVQATFQMVGTELVASRNALLVVSQANGARAEYGHLDVLAGRFADRDVFPRVVQWLGEAT